MKEYKFEVRLYFEGDINSDEEIEEIGDVMLKVLVNKLEHVPKDSDVWLNRIEVELPWNLGYIEKYL